MSKLTVIEQAKDYLVLSQKRMVYDESTHIIGSLLSLLEEKDKALAFYSDENRTFEEISDDGGFIARKALNTSSNNEGETI
ncbi:hypothetical protein MHI32_01490 [Paenibacillus sp. FSL H7-0690]|uniref:hypothetical protein n=1 Tax=Paenibacillus sp. FSL H7-0690 TaxID=2921437 RepID=UPI0030ED4C97